MQVQFAPFNHLDEITDSSEFAGHKVLCGHYRALNLPVSRDRLRKAINRVRETNNLPPRRSIHRRVYQVWGSLSLLHIDGHHKLVR